ncbi:DUF2642 domain-containing protein [Oceanobacillus halophilus]|uniref:DUF2642 domain-containing protein n=1 Tax=Oceanobacillus halophilus TaxID=930130 RepID=A0A495ADK1_9BACI|nr:DUF2642 domain-containing protein [Oceanobacillus halophilus]RKQ37986.1 DUF2642 domain-containing protein [Oceanobacillus halophilus]
MDLFEKYLQQQIEVIVSGTKRHSGILLAQGTDTIVIYNGEDYVYISNSHIQKLKKSERKKIQMTSEDEIEWNNLSIRKILTSYKGVFTEISVTDTETIHGYVTSVLNDYFVFYSPVYKTMFIPLKNIKWLIPYRSHQTPYALGNERFPVKPSNITVARTFDIQLEKLIGQIIILDLGLATDKIGQLKKITDNYLELATAREDSVYINLLHVKSVHFQ